ncbi:MAG: beta-glucosidase, partial [Bacteroidales bacterium]|nr:beta-glucosidase [Bacteroidales bacterium]
MKNFIIIGLLIFLAAGCGQSKKNEGEQDTKSAVSLSDEQLLDSVQYRYFQYFWDGAEPNSGMARERFHADGVYPQNDKHIVTTGGTGFGLMAILVGIERGFITRQQGLKRFQHIVDFLEKADRFHG